MSGRLLTTLVLTVLLSAPIPSVVAATAPTGLSTGLAQVDPATATWYLIHPDGSLTSFRYGVPGDVPLIGDWDCDGVDTPAMFRPSSGFVYLSNRNVTAVADTEFFFGVPGDVALVGDWDGDGCDTLGVYRNGVVFLKNRLGTGLADVEYRFGVPGDRPFAADFDGDGASSVGLYRQSSGFTYLRNSLTTGIAETEFFFGAASDHVLAADWDGNGTDTVGIYRSSDGSFHLRNSNDLGATDAVVTIGNTGWIALAGAFGTPEPGTSVNAIPRAGTLDVTPRSAWTKRESRPALMDEHEIEVLTVHHSGDGQPASTGPVRFRSWQSWHMDGQGWGDLAYHFIVGRDGTVYEGRSPLYAGDTATSYDPHGHLLVVLEGDFNLEEPTAAQVDSVVEVLAWGASTYNVSPTTIGGHRDHAPEINCPGEALYELITDGTIEGRVTQLLGG